MEDSDYSGDDTGADGDAPPRSRVRQLGQRGLAKVKDWVATGVAKVRDSDNERISAAAEKTGQGITTTGKKVKDLGDGAIEAAQRKVGLEDLVDELGKNLDKALLVIASQRDRIKQLEARLGRLEQES
jgi:chromosome segregation ATPase